MHLSSVLKAATILATFGIAAQAGAAPISVTTTNNAAALAGALAGNGIAISNPSFAGFSGGAGTFTGGNSAGLGFDTGIVLTTGNAISQAWATPGPAFPARAWAAPRRR